MKSERAVIPAFTFLRFVQRPKTSELEDCTLKRRVRCHLACFAVEAGQVCLFTFAGKEKLINQQRVARRSNFDDDHFGAVTPISWH